MWVVFKMISFNIVTLILSTAAFRTITCAYNEDGWNMAAEYLAEAMDTTAHPCEDFYQYACGNWKKKYPYRGDTEHLYARIHTQLLQAVKKINENDPATPDYKKSLKAFYSQCLNDTATNTDNLRSVYQHLENIMGSMPLLSSLSQDTEKAPATQSIYYTLGQVARKLGVHMFLKVRIGSQVEQCVPRPVVVIEPAAIEVMGLLYNHNYLDAIAVTAQAVNVSIDDDAIYSQMKMVSDNVCAATETLKQRGIDTDSELAVRLSNLSAIGNVSWEDYFNGLLPTDFLQAWKRQDAKIILRAPDYFRFLDEHLATIPPDQFKNFIYAVLLHTVYKDEGNSTYDDNPNKKVAKCIRTLMAMQGPACASTLIESYGTDLVHWSRDVELIAESVFAAFRFMVQTTDWLDLENRLALIDKVNAITFSSGVPQWMLNSSLLDQHTYAYDSSAQFLDNLFKMKEKKFLNEIRQVVDQELLPGAYSGFYGMYQTDPNFVPNAYYFRQAIRLHLGEVLPPRYNYSFPLSLKFGQAGWTIGHELFHGYDYGRTPLAYGVKRKLLPAALRRFNKLVNCIRRQYSGFCFGGGEGCISGTRTVNDNIADVEGLKVSYMAYKFLLQTSGPEKPLPGILANFTEDQLYFVSMARPWCGNDLLSQKDLKSDPHSPARARVEVPIMNFPAFARAFHCPVGSIYAPLTTCNLWGDFLEPRVAA